MAMQQRAARPAPAPAPVAPPCTRCGQEGGACRRGDATPFRDAHGQCAECSMLDEGEARGDNLAVWRKHKRGNRSPFATLLKRHRDARRWSQERLSAEAEIDTSLVSRLESGERQPTRESIAKLCTGLALTRREADALWLSARFLPPDLDPGPDATAALSLWRGLAHLAPAPRGALLTLVESTLSLAQATPKEK